MLLLCYFLNFEAFLILNIFIRFVYLKDGIIRVGGIFHFPSTGLLLKWPWQPELGCSEARNQELFPDLSAGAEPRQLGCLLLLFQWAEREVEQPDLKLVPRSVNNVFIHYVTMLTIKLWTFWLGTYSVKFVQIDPNVKCPQF